MTSTAELTQRKALRLSTNLPIRLEAHETNNKVWREITHLRSVSDIGADFYLNRCFIVGQLIFLTLPLDKSLRHYDFDAEQYCIWGIVRHCYQTTVGKSSVYHIGVAFIGKEPPYSYRKNPWTIYKLCEIKEDGLWKIGEEIQFDAPRQQTRYNIPVEIYLAVCDENDSIIAHEKTVTENISASGAAVFSSLDLNVGDKVKVMKQHGGFSATAIVRKRRVGTDNLPRLHLEFIDAQFPIEGIG
jgi:hypothetical protein